MPVSHTCRRTPCAPWRRAATSTPPRRVWRSALPTRLRSTWSSSIGSLSTCSVVGRSSRRRPRAWASAWWCRARPSNSACNGTAWRSGAPAALSSRDRSSRPRSRPSSARTAPWMRSSTPAWPASATRSRARPTSRPMAATGWRRSWLAAARKRVLAASASCNARVRSATRASSRSARSSLTARARTSRWISTSAKLTQPNGTTSGIQYMPVIGSRACRNRSSCTPAATTAARPATSAASAGPGRRHRLRSSRPSASRLSSDSSGYIHCRSNGSWPLAPNIAPRTGSTSPRPRSSRRRRGRVSPDRAMTNSPNSTTLTHCTPKNSTSPHGLGSGVASTW